MRETDRASFQPADTSQPSIPARVVQWLLGSHEARWKAREKRQLGIASKAMDRAVDARQRAETTKRR